MIHQQLGLVVSAPLVVFAEDRHEGLRKRALGKQAAQQVGQTGGDNIGVVFNARTEEARDQHVPHEGQNARNQRQTANGGEGFEEIHTGYGLSAGNAAHHTIAPHSPCSTVKVSIYFGILTGNTQIVRVLHLGIGPTAPYEKLCAHTSITMEH